MSSSTKNLVTGWIGNDANIEVEHKDSKHGPHMNGYVQISDDHYVPVLSAYFTTPALIRLRDALNALDLGISSPVGRVIAAEVTL